MESAMSDSENNNEAPQPPMAAEEDIREKLKRPYRPTTRPVEQPEDAPNKDWFDRFDY